MTTPITRIIIYNIAIIIVKNMDISLRIASISGNYKRWLSQTTCFSCHKTSHISKHCPTRSKAPSCEFFKGKGKVDVEHIKNDMNKTWKKKDASSTSNGEGITSPNGSGDHTLSN